MIKEDSEYKYITYIDLNGVERTVKIPKFITYKHISIDYKTGKKKEVIEKIPVENMQA